MPEPGIAQFIFKGSCITQGFGFVYRSVWRRGGRGFVVGQSVSEVAASFQGSASLDIFDTRHSITTQCSNENLCFLAFGSKLSRKRSVRN